MFNFQPNREHLRIQMEHFSIGGISCHGVGGRPGAPRNRAGGGERVHLAGGQHPEHALRRLAARVLQLRQRAGEDDEGAIRPQRCLQPCL